MTFPDHDKDLSLTLNIIIATGGEKDPVPQRDGTETFGDCGQVQGGPVKNLQYVRSGAFDLYVSLDAMKNDLWLSPPLGGACERPVFIGEHEG